MIASMTAFGRTEETTDVGHIIWEIRTVNHRYLEINTRLPDDLRALEATVRQHISDRIKRGKIDCTLRFEAKMTNVNELVVNQELIDALIKSMETLKSALPDAGAINPLDLLNWPGVIRREGPDPDLVSAPLMQQLDTTLDYVIENRQREGEKLCALVVERCEGISKIIDGLREKLPEIMDSLRDRLLIKTQELEVELDKDRLEQELLLLVQKADVTEEIDRLTAHIEEVKLALNSDEPVGRRLDFLMQELNREANTLGSKSVHYYCSNASVELKVLIEQMREQIQNIE